MEAQTKNCQNCKTQFTIEPDDFAFYEKIKVPPPTFCPECRLVRRLAWRNERALYKRKCNLCGQDKILMFPEGSPFTAYCRECWWSDKWDSSSYGKDVDFSKPFLIQFSELLRTVPRIGNLKQGNIVESDYTNRVSDLRNCYLLYGSNLNENCRYGSWMNDAKECMDGYNVQKSEQCYECVDCAGCYNLSFSQECASCSNSRFLFNCRNCESCFGCVNLRSKSYCIFNKQYSKEDYQKLTAKFDTGSALVLEGLKSKFAALRSRAVVPSIVTHHSSEISGNWIEGANNAKIAFNCSNVEDVKYAFSLIEAKDSMDYCHWGRGTEQVYESINVGRQCSKIMMCSECWDQNHDLQYCLNCHTSSYLFGCIGLRNKQYCILNKQYTKEEYEQLLPRLIRHIDIMPYRDAKGREYRHGEFFPPELSPFAYNETIAQEFFPTSKEAATAQGYSWKEPESKQYVPTLTAEGLPDHIREANDSITKEIIQCAHEGNCNEQCTTAFRVIPAELEIYRRLNVPLPRLCPNCRHYIRLKQRNPLRLRQGRCACAGAKALPQQNTGFEYRNTVAHSHGAVPCPSKFETTYPIGGREIVYCEQCYQAEVA